MTILRALARRLPQGQADDAMEAFAQQAAADYETMLGLDRSLDERRADFTRIANKAPVIRRG